MTQTSSNSPAGNSFAEACIVARDLWKHVDGSIELPVRIKEKLIPAVCKIHGGSGYSIDLLPKPYPQNFCYGMLWRYENRAEIRYASHLNLCHRRFVVCKELAHLLFDNEQVHYTSDPVALIQSLLADVPSLETGDIISEKWAAIVAVEMLMPWPKRQIIFDMSKAGKTDMEIAIAIRAPQNLVTLMLHSKYGGISARYNGSPDIPPQRAKPAI